MPRITENIWNNQFCFNQVENPKIWVTDMIEWTTNIMNEKIILRWYENIVQNLQNIWVDIKQIDN